MRNQTQEQQIIYMMKRPIPKKKVGIIKLKMIRKATAIYGTRPFNNPEEAVKMMQPLFEYSDREMMVVLSLDASANPLAIETAAVGRLCTSSINPRNLFKNAILPNAAAIICFHNHPSGNSIPSYEDTRITERIKAAGDLLGINLVDHIVMGAGGSYFSFKENKKAPFEDWRD